MATAPGTGVGVVLVNYQCLDLIQRQLASGALHGAEVVLVDNASDPAKLRALADEYGARYLLLERNLGFAGGVNAALREGWAQTTEAVLLLNPDAQLAVGQLGELRAAMVAAKADAAAPVMLDGSGRPWVSSAGGPVSIAAVTWYFAGISHVLPRLSGFFWTRRQVRNSGHLSPAWLCGAVLLVARSAWERFGLLPEDELVYGEDVGWGIHCTAAGGHLVLVGSIEVAHTGGASGGSARWVGATGRLFERELGPVRGKIATVIMRIGLGARRVLRRLLGTSIDR